MYIACPAKINLGLRINERLASGYHTISSFFVPISLVDILEVVPIHGGKTTLHISGIDIPGSLEDNIIFRLLRTLCEERIVSRDQAWDIFLHKQIPTGAGMGGGSSDVVAMLHLLERTEKLSISPQQKQSIVQRMGSDCMFFLSGVPAFVSGMGEEVKALDVSADFFDRWVYVLVYPDIHISTVWAYAKYDELQRTASEAPPVPLTPELIHSPVSQWKDLLPNDFERAIFPHHPILPEIKEWLYAQGAVYASMSGSGSTIYGMFPQGTLDMQAMQEGLRVLLSGRISYRTFRADTYHPSTPYERTAIPR